MGGIPIWMWWKAWARYTTIAVDTEVLGVSAVLAESTSTSWDPEASAREKPSSALLAASKMLC